LALQSRVPQNVQSIVLLLHGLGASGDDLIGLGEAWQQTLPNTAFYSPDAPEPCDMAPFGYQWFSLRNWSTASIADGLSRARPVVDQLIDKLLADHNLPASKLTLAGFSQGTMLSLYAGLQRKEPIAGILGYSGALIGISSVASKPPVQLVHGLADSVVPAMGTKQAADFLQKAGVEVEAAFIPNLDHGIDPEGLDLGQKFLQRVLQ
jgi:phospholipase/carboxylesterase